MAVSAEYLEFLKEQMEPFGAVDVKRMFGGVGLFREGLMFGLIADETLYLKADEGNRVKFESASSKPFAYERGGKTMHLSYWQLPEHLQEEPEELCIWLQDAFDAALRADGKKPPKQRKHTI